MDAPRWAVRGALLFCFGGFDLIINAGCKVTSSLRFFFWFLFIHIHRSMCCLHFHLIYVAIRTPLMLVFFFFDVGPFSFSAGPKQPRFIGRTTHSFNYSPEQWRSATPVVHNNCSTPMFKDVTVLSRHGWVYVTFDSHGLLIIINTNCTFLLLIRINRCDFMSF